MSSARRRAVSGPRIGAQALQRSAAWNDPASRGPAERWSACAPAGPRALPLPGPAVDPRRSLGPPQQRAAARRARQRRPGRGGGRPDRRRRPRGQCRRVVEPAAAAAQPANPWYEVELTDARRDLLRRALFALGHPVEKMKRVKLGPLKLGNLAEGHYRRLEPREVKQLRRFVEQPKGAMPARREKRTNRNALRQAKKSRRSTR